MYNILTKPVYWTKDEDWAMESIFQFKPSKEIDEDFCFWYYTSVLGILAGILYFFRRR